MQCLWCHSQQPLWDFSVVECWFQQWWHTPGLAHAAPIPAQTSGRTNIPAISWKAELCDLTTMPGLGHNQAKTRHSPFASGLLLLCSCLHTPLAHEVTLQTKWPVQVHHQRNQHNIGYKWGCRLVTTMLASCNWLNKRGTYHWLLGSGFLHGVEHFHDTVHQSLHIQCALWYTLHASQTDYPGVAMHSDHLQETPAVHIWVFDPTTIRANDRHHVLCCITQKGRIYPNQSLKAPFLRLQYLDVTFWQQAVSIM